MTAPVRILLVYGGQPNGRTERLRREVVAGIANGFPQARRQLDPVEFLPDVFGVARHLHRAVAGGGEKGDQGFAGIHEMVGFW